MLMASLTQLSQGSLTLVQYIDKATELRDEFEALELKASLPLLCQRFITGLSDELQIACGPALHSILRDKSKSLDDLADELRSMALLLPQTYATANVTRSNKPARHQLSCTHCGKRNHTKDRCYQLHPELKEQSMKPRPENARKRTHQKPKDQHAIVMVVGEEGFVSALQNLDQNSFWYDTMATHHVVFNEALLSNRRPSRVSAVVLGGNEKHTVSCQGDLRVEGGPCGPITFTDVICAPTLMINLCSGPQFTNKGGESWQGGDKCKLMKQGQILLEGRKVGNMYKLSCRFSGVITGKSQCYAHSTSALWHRRLGHPGSQVVSHLVKTNAVQGMGTVSLPKEETDCMVCLQAKQTRESYSRSTSQASNPLELIHSDLLELPCEALEGEKYLFTVLDDYSRYGEVVCINRKSSVTDELIAVLTRWQRQTGCAVKCVRTDQGTEYYGLDKYCR
jgi:histone deacetylase 1/2